MEYLVIYVWGFLVTVIAAAIANPDWSKNQRDFYLNALFWPVTTPAIVLAKFLSK